MKRRWFGIVLVVWALLSPFINAAPPLAPTALAAGEFGQFTSAGTIELFDGAFNNIPANESNIIGTGTGPYTGSHTDVQGRTACQVNYRLVNVQKAAGGGYTGTFSTTYPAADIGCANKPDFFNGTLQISDPKGVGPLGGSPGGGTGANGNPTSCNAGPGFSWLICGLINISTGIADWIVDNVIQPFLHETPLTTTGATAPIYKIWSAFRNVATVFFILIFFFIIFGTALGLDNYSIKKILPRLIAGAILVPFSWYICTIGIDIGNILGQGLVALINPIIGKPVIDFDTPFSALFGLTAAGLGSLALIGAIASFGFGIIITILIALMVALFTLVFRKILIILLVVLSPFALLAWILPNTEKWFRQWYTNLLKVILMYPLMMLILEAGRLFSVTAGATFASQGAVAQGAVPLIQLAGLYLPLVALPFTYSWAGGAMKAGSGAIGKFGASQDKRFGKDSDFAKNQAETRQRNSLLRMERSNNPFGRSYHRLRSGTGAGLTGLTAGSGVKQVERDKKLNEAHDTMGGVRTLQRREAEVGPEEQQAKIDALAQQGLNAEIDKRAGRAGTMEAHNAGNPAASQTRLTAVTETERVKQSELAGQHQVIAEAATPGGIGYGSPDSAHIASAAGVTEFNKQAKARAAVVGTNISEANLNAAAGPNPASARVARFNQAVEVHAAHTTGELDTEVGDVQGKAAIEEQEIANYMATTGATHAVAAQAVSRIRSGQTITSSRLNSREKAGVDAATRERRVEMEATGGAESAQDILTSAGVAARDKFAQEKADRESMRTVDTASGENAASVLADTRLAAEQKRTDVVGGRQGLGQGKTGLAGTPQAPTLQKRLAAARQKGAKAAGAEAGEIKSINNAADAEAKLDNVAAGSDAAFEAAAARSAKAGEITGTKKLAEAFGNEQAAIDADSFSRISADEIAEQAAREQERAMVVATDTTREKLKAAQGAQRAIQDKARANGKKVPSDNAARRQLMRTASRAAMPGARIEAEKVYTDDVSTIAGHERAITNAMNNAAAAGTPYKATPLVKNRKTGKLEKPADYMTARQVAEEALFATLQGQAEREAYTKAMARGGEAEGVAEARALQLEAAQDILAKEQGLNRGTLTPAQAAKLKADASETIERGAYGTLVKNTREKITASTGSEIGTMRGEEAGIEKEGQKIRSEEEKAAQAAVDAAAKKKGKPLTPLQEAKARASVPLLSADALRARARQNIATEHVTKAANDAEAKAGGDIGEEAGAVELRDTAEELEMNNTLNRDLPKGLKKDARLEDGTVIPAGTPLKKGQTFQDGSVLPKYARGISRAEARQRLAQKAVTAGRETGIRSQTTKQGDTTALSQAVAGGTATAEERLASATQARRDALATETAGIQVQNQIVGTPLQKGYSDTVADATRVKYEQVLDSEISKAKEREIPLYEMEEYKNPVTGLTTLRPVIDPATKLPIPRIDPVSGEPIVTRVKNATVDPPGIATLRYNIEQALKSGDTAAMSAYARQLGISSGGRRELDDLRRTFFGGNPKKTILGKYTIEDFRTKAAPGDQTYLWEKAMEGVNVGGAPTLLKPEEIALTDVSEDDFLKWDNAEFKIYADFYERVKGNIKAAQSAKADPGWAGLSKDEQDSINSAITGNEKIRKQVLTELKLADWRARTGTNAGKFGETKRDTIDKFYAAHKGEIKAPDYSAGAPKNVPAADVDKFLNP